MTARAFTEWFASTVARGNREGWIKLPEDQAELDLILAAVQETASTGRGELARSFIFDSFEAYFKQAEQHRQYLAKVKSGQNMNQFSFSFNRRGSNWEVVDCVGQHLYFGRAVGTTEEQFWLSVIEKVAKRAGELAVKEDGLATEQTKRQE